MYLGNIFCLGCIGDVLSAMADKSNEKMFLGRWNDIKINSKYCTVGPQ